MYNCLQQLSGIRKFENSFHTICRNSGKIKIKFELLVVVLHSFNCVQLFVNTWTAAHQVSLSFTISWSLLKLLSIESVLMRWMKLESIIQSEVSQKEKHQYYCIYNSIYILTQRKAMPKNAQTTSQLHSSR